MLKHLFKYIMFILCLSFWCKLAMADIEPVNILVKNVVASVAETKKQVSDAADAIGKVKTQITNGFSKAKSMVQKVKDGVEKVKNFVEDPVGSLKTMVMGAFQKDDPEETGFEALEKTKETYSRKKGVKDNIALQKAMNKVIDKEKFNNISRLYARSISKRLALKQEQTEEPDLSTLAAARRAATEKQINLGKRYNNILETQAYINSFNHTIQIQNYQIEEEEE